MKHHDPEHLRQLLETKVCPKGELFGVDLSKAGLSKAVLYSSDVREATLAKANLANAEVREAHRGG
ncbi:MAG: pentapeptide repeat-containing protein, partial [SAR324 cluster bacterium]|nr:pentapeptide repeat-containing protein [SAR324 cluster bacterium]